MKCVRFLLLSCNSKRNKIFFLRLCHAAAASNLKLKDTKGEEDEREKVKQERELKILSAADWLASTFQMRSYEEEKKIKIQENIKSIKRDFCELIN